MPGIDALKKASHKANKAVRRRVSTVTRIRHDHRVASYRDRPLLENFVLYETFDGMGILCNPAAIFKELLDDTDYSHLQHVWVLRDQKTISQLIGEYRENSNVSFVLYRSARYFELLSRVKYLVNNSSFPAEFTKRSNQIYLNTWHGVPVKKMGYDVKSGRADVRNVLRNFLAADFLVSSGRYITNLMYRDAFKLNNIYAGSILEIGLPRNDVLHRSLSNSTKDDNKILNAIDPRWKEKTVVLFAPTWRGNNPYEVSDISYEAGEEAALLQRLLGEKYLVICKFHQLVEKRANDNLLVSDRIISSVVDTNQLLPYVDILVTDYSSIFVDFTILDRPIHFLIKDEGSYELERGLYRATNDFPGEVSSNVHSLARAVLTSNAKKYSSQRQVWREQLLQSDIGNACRRIVDEVFGIGAQTGASSVSLRTQKKRMLVHVGSLIPNGITTAAINLVRNLDYDNFDVTVVYPYSANKYQVAKSLELDSRARVLPRVGRVALRVGERRAYWAFTKGGGERINPRYLRKIPSIFAREYQRCFGEVKFDIALGFDGYQVFWTQLLLQSAAKIKYLWAHNDLSLDSHREINGSKPHFVHLTSVFTLYHQFTGIVSVTKDLTAINRTKLSHFALPEKFVTINNFLDASEILRKSNLLPSVDVPLGSTTFVTVGRLSPEKNQSRIIRAFAVVNKNFPASKLLIVGDGPLSSHLQNLARDLGIESAVDFVGLQENPYPYMKNSDCFVFSSEYEGQGLAILESLVLKVPVISTRFNVVESVLNPGDGLIVDATDRDLATAMNEFCSNRLPTPAFDADDYNRRALEQLNDVLGR